MTDKERYESLRHCRWVDEVIPDAPWVLTEEFLDKHQIDYVAHDSLPALTNSHRRSSVWKRQGILEDDGGDVGDD
ncbi:unnamed protein product [Ilex paraguariensis]|uniref:choline-phosphate cytidylyltransferase n=1 Tax=Ilex paraguariensis TaxID=185542 RepID=A0ABC8SMK8_9AQUA